MIELYKNLFVDNDLIPCMDLKTIHNLDFAVVHACKHPCHKRLVGYASNLSQDHPNYLIAKQEDHLALNIVDLATELDSKFTNAIFYESFVFIHKHLTAGRKVLVHCNKAFSRSPSIILAYLSNRGILVNGSYFLAAESFKQTYPFYNPNTGIALYLKSNWAVLMNINLSTATS